MRLRLLACGGGLLFLVTSCGGTVAGGDPTGGEQLRTTGVQRCKSACAALSACGYGSSCACSCAPCPAGSTDCTCAPCDCGGSTPEKCEADCNEGVNRVLGSWPQCENQMLAELDCLGSASCQPGTSQCKAEKDAVDTCTAGDSKGSTTPPATTGAASGDPGGVTCRSGSAGGSLPRGTPPRPGDPICDNGWDSCSDGRRYSIQCVATSTSDLACSCIVNGATESSFMGRECTADPVVASSSCGWNLL